MDGMPSEPTTESVRRYAEQPVDAGDCHAHDAVLGMSEPGHAREPTRDHDVRTPASAARDGSKRHAMPRLLEPIILALKSAHTARGTFARRGAVRAATAPVSSSPRSAHQGPPDLSQSAPLWIRVLG
jgi:hypothetical protein